MAVRAGLNPVGAPSEPPAHMVREEPEDRDESETTIEPDEPGGQVTTVKGEEVYIPGSTMHEMGFRTPEEYSKFQRGELEGPPSGFREQQEKWAAESGVYEKWLEAGGPQMVKEAEEAGRILEADIKTFEGARPIGASSEGEILWKAPTGELKWAPGSPADVERVKLSVQLTEAGALKSGKLDLAAASGLLTSRQAGLFGIKPSQMEEAKLARMQSLRQRGALRKLEDYVIPQETLPEGVYGPAQPASINVVGALRGDVPESTLLAAGIGRPDIAKARQYISDYPTIAEMEKAVSADTFTTQYFREKGWELPTTLGGTIHRGVASEERVRQLDLRMMESSAAYQEKFGTGTLLRSGGAKLSAMVIPVFGTKFQPGGGRWDFSATAIGMTALNIALITSPAWVPRVSGLLAPKPPTIAYGAVTRLGGPTPGLAKGVPVRGMGEIPALEGKLYRTPYYTPEGRYPIEGIRVVPAVGEAAPMFRYTAYGETLGGTKLYGPLQQYQYRPGIEEVLAGGRRIPGGLLGGPEVPITPPLEFVGLRGGVRLAPVKPVVGGAPTVYAPTSATMTPAQVARLLGPSGAVTVSAVSPLVMFPGEASTFAPFIYPYTRPTIRPFIVPSPGAFPAYAPEPRAVPTPYPIAPTIWTPEPVTVAPVVPEPGRPPVLEPVFFPTPVPVPTPAPMPEPTPPIPTFPVPPVVVEPPAYQPPSPTPFEPGIIPPFPGFGYVTMLGGRRRGKGIGRLLRGGRWAMPGLILHMPEPLSIKKRKIQLTKKRVRAYGAREKVIRPRLKGVML